MKNTLFICPRLLQKAGIVLSVLLLLASCAPPIPMTNTHPTETPAPTATPAHPVLYALTFENESAFFGWHVGAPGQNDWLKNTRDGKYLFEYPSGFLENRDFDFRDIQIRVEVEFLVKTRMEAGLACRMQPGGGERYTFLIANDGRWSIRNGESTLAEGWSDQIKPDKNLLAARCVGDHLSLLVNNVELGSAQDGKLISGSINFSYAAESAAAGTFDNISVEDWGDEAKSQAESKPEGKTATLQSTVTESVVPTPVPVMTATPPGLFYANHFESGSTGLDGWKIYEMINTRHSSSNDPNIELVDKRLRLNGSNSQPLYLMYDAFFPLSDGWNIAMNMSFGEIGNAGIALICQYSEDGWYELGINTDRSWQIKRADSASETNVAFSILAEGTSSAITPEENLIEITCRKNDLSLRVNGQPVGAAIDPNPLEGGVFGLVYREEKDQSVYASIRAILLSEPDGKNIKEFTDALDSFYFSLSTTSVSYGLPRDVRSIVKQFSDNQVEDGRLAVSLDTAGRWVAISPQTFPANVDFSADIDTSELNGFSFGVGLICRWREADGGYALWYVADRFMTTPIGMSEYGIPSVNGPAEFFKDDKDGILRKGTEHHLMVRCWNDLVEMFVDGQKISSYDRSSFPYEGNYKTGNQVGVYIYSTRENTTKAFFDNFNVSWNVVQTSP